MSLSRSLGRIVLAALVVAACGSQTQLTSQLSMTIGVPEPLTGSEASIGDTMVKAAQLAVSQATGINVRLILEDEACDPQAGVNATNALIAQRVTMVVGFYCSGAALPSTALLHRAHIPVIVAAAENPQITEQGFPEVFRTQPTSNQEAPAAAKVLKERYGARTVALIHDNTALQKGIADLTKAALTELGVNVVLVSVITPHSNDFGVAVAKINSVHPDAVFACLYFDDGGLLAKQLLASGYPGKLLMSGGSEDPGFVKIAGEETAGKVLIMGIPDAYNLPAAKSFIQDYTAKYGAEPGPISIYTYDAINVAIAVVKQANSTNPDKIIAGLRSYHGVGLIGPISFDDHGQLVATSGFVALAYRNGHLVIAP